MTKIVLQHLERVIARSKDTWFSIHRKIFPSNGGPAIYPGSAHQSMRTAVLDVMYWMNRGFDVYLANGGYTNTLGPSPPMPYPKALRKAYNLACCKCLYMDIDVKPGAFASTSEAATAMDAFIRATKIPSPTVIVESGSGGFHCYWTLAELITPAEHRELSGRLVAAATANGIHFDEQCTNDPTRLLRVAGTWNFKSGTAMPVVLNRDSGKDIDNDEMRLALAPYGVALTPKSKLIVPSSATVGGFDDNDDLALPKNFSAISIDEIGKNCPFVADTLASGGAGYAEPTWKHTIDIACHTSDPKDAAHRLSQGHIKYTADGTDDKLAIAQQQRALNPNLGPPLCATLHRNKVAQCQTCPHLSLNTTPTIVGFKLANPNPGASPGQTVAPNILGDLPFGYYRHAKDGTIYKEVTLKEGGFEQVCAFEYQIIPDSGYIEKSYDKPDKISFDTIQAGKQKAISFDSGTLTDLFSMTKALANESLPITGDPKHTRQFMAAYLKQLARTDATLIDAPAFGWHPDSNGDWGFAYAGEYTSPLGTKKCAHPGAGGEQYKVVGEIQPWQDLAAIVMTPDRPDLCCMVATSFGAPLISMSGQDGLLLGLWSSGSGIGKTTALKLNQAVWSAPTLGGLSDTVNYTFAKCTLLRHLPVNYDEIKGARQVQAMADIVLQLTQGGEKGRSGRAGEMRIKRDFVTNCNYAANSSIIAAVREHNRGTDASWLRMFEMRGLKSGVLTHSVSDVGRMAAALKMNHGGIGRKYAAFLGANRAMVEAEHTKMQAALEVTLRPQQDERFWMSAISTTLIGAKFANILGLANFPLKEMYAYMIGEYWALKKELVVNSGNYDNATALVSALGAYLNDRRERGMVVLDKTWTKSGRPAKNYAKVLNDGASKQWQRIEVQISGDPLTLRVSDKGFGEWCERTNYPKASIVSALKAVGARLSGSSLASGSHKAGSTENLWIMSPIDAQLLPVIDEYVTQYGLVP